MPRFLKNNKKSFSNFHLHDDEDDIEPIREPEDSDDLIILEEIIPEECGDIVAGPSQNEGISPGESGIIVAAPPQNEGHKNKKRKQPSITAFFVKKQINKE